MRRVRNARFDKKIPFFPGREVKREIGARQPSARSDAILVITHPPDIFAVAYFHDIYFPNIPPLRTNDASRTLDAHGLRISMPIRKPANHACRAGTESGTSMRGPMRRYTVQYTEML